MTDPAAADPPAAPTLDFYFFIGSIYSYLSVMTVDAEAAAAGIAVRWRPFNLRAILAGQGPPPARNPVKMRYSWRDLERRAARAGIPIRPDPPYPVDPDLLANRVAVVAADEGWVADFTRAVFTAWMREHARPEDPQTLSRAIAGAGRDPEAAIGRANSDPTAELYAAWTETARRLGVFGAPTFAVGAELFWGSDRLPDALDWALGRAGPDEGR